MNHPVVTFYYNTGEAVQLHDKVLSADRPGSVVMVIQPGTRESRDYSCPSTGGVMIEEDWDGGNNLMLMEPPDRDQWEDLEFVSRG